MGVVNSRPDISTEVVAQRYAAGESSHSIAADFACSVRTVFLRLAKAGVQPRGQGKVKPFGKKHPKWTGGRSITPSGYVVLSVRGQRVLEHRYVAEQMLGRALQPGEDVHHLDGNRANNQPDNLLVMSTLEHHRLHWKHAPRTRGANGQWVTSHREDATAAAV